MPTNLDKFMMLSTEEIHKALSVIIEKKIPIQRRKPDGTFAFIPPREFDNYMKSRELSFFIDKDVFNKELSRYYSSDSPDLSADLLEIVSEAGQSNESFEPDKQFECELNVARQMNFSERIDTVRPSRTHLCPNQ